MLFYLPPAYRYPPSKGGTNFFCVKTADTLQRFRRVCIYLLINNSFLNYTKF